MSSRRGSRGDSKNENRGCAREAGAQNLINIYFIILLRHSRHYYIMGHWICSSLKLS